VLPSSGAVAAGPVLRAVAAESVLRAVAGGTGEVSPPGAIPQPAHNSSAMLSQAMVTAGSR
jgi:hypothetical protein